MKTVPLSKGMFAIVDDEDYGRVMAMKWSARQNGSRQKRWYAVAVKSDDFQIVTSKNGVRYRKFKQIHMHRFIIDAPPGFDVDHVNRDSLDNRRENLRIATRSQNNVNRAAAGRRGVRKPSKNSPSWIAYITVGGVQLHLGSYHCEAHAQEAYDTAARAFHGEFFHPST
jgi:hypothetical protein